MSGPANEYVDYLQGYTSAVESPAIVKVRGVDYAFGKGESRKQVLFDNNLDIFPGEITIMTGPSGSGKTTLLTLIGALRSLQSGNLEVFGQELADLSNYDQIIVRRSIGFIFQQHNLFESLTAFQNVMLAAEVAGRSAPDCRQMSQEILVSLGLEQRMHYKPQKLSGGQRQRVAIARAMVHHPRLILADEPTAALDKDTGREVVKLFQKLAAEHGSAILIVTHDNRILDVADRIVNMVDGSIISNVNVALSLKDAAFLRKCPAFTGLPPLVLAEAASKMNTEFFPAHAEIIRQGDKGDKFYVIRTGQVEALKTKEGQTNVMAQLGPGDFFGELALLEGTPRAATIRSLTPCELASLSQQDFQALVESSHDFEVQLRKTYFYR